MLRDLLVHQPCLRVANFLNSELYGKETEIFWSVIFPKIDNLTRHPSQIYEAIFEGIENNDFYIFTHKGYEEHIQNIADVHGYTNPVDLVNPIEKKQDEYINFSFTDCPKFKTKRYLKLSQLKLQKKLLSRLILRQMRKH